MQTLNTSAPHDKKARERILNFQAGFLHWLAGKNAQARNESSHGAPGIHAVGLKVSAGYHDIGVSASFVYEVRQQLRGVLKVGVHHAE